MLCRLERKQLGQPDNDHPALEALLLHCARGWEHSGGATHTSLRQLEQATDCSAADLRDALHSLGTAGEVQLRYGKSGAPVRAADLPVRAVFELVADWSHINSNRPRPL